MKATRDMKLPGIVKKLVDKSQVLFPGIEFAEIDKMEWKMHPDIPVIVWNHRWEHDKNPESYFSALDLLKQRGFDFRLIVLGQEFERSPACFALAKKKFKNKIVHFGFVPSYKKYIELLSQGDIVISTSHHEFYGISIIEAVRSGCVPILPDRLSYPELFDKKFLYSDDSFAEKLEKVIGKHCRLSREKAKAITDQFNWLNVKKQYSEWL